MNASLSEVLARLESATLALATAADEVDLDAVEAALAERAEGIRELEARLGAGPAPAPLRRVIEEVLESDRWTHEALLAREAEGRLELERIRAARCVAERLSSGRGPARFVNERI